MKPILRKEPILFILLFIISFLADEQVKGTAKKYEPITTNSLSIIDKLNANPIFNNIS